MQSFYVKTSGKYGNRCSLKVRWSSCAKLLVSGSLGWLQ